MNQTTAVVLIVIGGLNLVATGTLAFALLKVGKQVDNEVTQAKITASGALHSIRSVLDSIEI